MFFLTTSLRCRTFLPSEAKKGKYLKRQLFALKETLEGKYCIIRCLTGNHPYYLLDKGMLRQSLESWGMSSCSKKKKRNLKMKKVEN